LTFWQPPGGVHKQRTRIVDVESGEFSRRLFNRTLFDRRAVGHPCDTGASYCASMSISELVYVARTFEVARRRNRNNNVNKYTITRVIRAPGSRLACSVIVFVTLLPRDETHSLRMRYVHSPECQYEIIIYRVRSLVCTYDTKAESRMPFRRNADGERTAEHHCVLPTRPRCQPVQNADAPESVRCEAPNARSITCALKPN
jgi:hypothetical protein